MNNILFCLLFVLPHCTPLSDNIHQLVQSWAPLVWLHSDEQFFPSSVPFYLNNVELRDKNETVIAENVTSSDIPRGNISAEYHLNTVLDVNCSDCYQDFFKGEAVEEVPIYTFVTEYNDLCRTVDITYNIFSPFNYGTDVCLGVQFGDECLGSYKLLGNHMADWEHFTIRLEKEKPSLIFLSSHNFGGWYRWEEASGGFNFTRAVSWEEQAPANQSFRELELEDMVKFPQRLDLEAGRLVLYSANGSHGLWAQPGTHTYLDLGFTSVSDETDNGTAWETWNNIEIFEVQDLDMYTGNSTWLAFMGKWGNIKKMDCEIEAISGQCGFKVAPSGPYRFFGHDMEFNGERCRPGEEDNKTLVENLTRVMA